jgi:hypothetical protein
VTLVVDCAHIWPAKGVEPRNHWGMLAGLLGFTKLERALIIGVRGASVNAPKTHGSFARVGYFDTGILLWPDAVTAREPFVFPLATYPYQTRSSSSDDGDGDGDGDVATILPGHYVLSRARTGSDPIWTMATLEGGARIPCSRDMNHNGRIDPSEAARVFTASAILLHKGASNGRSSIGCQTGHLGSLQRIIPAGTTLDYRLVLGADVASLMPKAEPPKGVA